MGVDWCYQLLNHIPSGKLSHNYGKWPIFNGKIHYKWWFSIAMLNYQRVINPYWCYQYLSFIIDSICSPLLMTYDLSTCISFIETKGVICGSNGQRPKRFMLKPLHERSCGWKCVANHGKRCGELLKAITWFDGEVERCCCICETIWDCIATSYALF